VAWQVAIERGDGPTALIFSRQKLPVFDQTKLAPAAGLRQGAYVLSGRQGHAGDHPASDRLGGVASARHAGRASQAGRPGAVVASQAGSCRAAPQSTAMVRRREPARLSNRGAVAQGWHRWVGDRATS